MSLNNYIRTISKLDTPSKIRNRIVDIDEDDVDQSKLTIGLTENGDPAESDNNYLVIDKLDDEKGHLHIYSERPHIDDFATYLSDIVDILGEVELDPITYRISIKKEFESLDLNVEVTLPDEFEKDIYQITGVRFDIGDSDSDYLIQKNPSTGDTRLRHGRGPVEVNSGSVEGIIEEEIEEASAFIGSL